MEMINLHCLISDKPLRVQIEGLESPKVVGNQSTFLCRADFYWFPNVTFIWNLEARELLLDPAEASRYDNNTASFSSRLLHTFDLEEKDKKLSCTVRVNIGVGKTVEETDSTLIDLYRKFCDFLLNSLIAHHNR